MSGLNFDFAISGVKWRDQTTSGHHLASLMNPAIPSAEITWKADRGPRSLPDVLQHGIREL
jgi:hypothetical protein